MVGEGNPKRRIDIEGYSPEEILALPLEELEAFVLTDEPLIIRAGSAEILGRFVVRDDALIVELAQIDGGGEGVLTTLISLIGRYAAKRRLIRIEWVIHAVTCAKPNLKLRRVLERRGFAATTRPGVGEVYFLETEVH